MKNSNEIKFEKRELIIKLLELVFEKVKIESKEKKPYGITRYLRNNINDKINERTLTRYYNGFILKQEKDKNTPTDYNLDILSEYLGYENFKKFELSLECELEKEKLRQEKRTIERKLNKVMFIGAFSCLVLLGVSIFYILNYYEKNCMIWVEDHYEKIRCSGLHNEKELDEEIKQNFKKVKVCKDSTIFFIDGEPIIHYTRHNNNFDFFTDVGEHPIYHGVYTNPITRTIIESRVKPCDSIN